MADLSTIASTERTRNKLPTHPVHAVGNGRSGMIGAALSRVTTLLEERTDGQWRFRMPGIRRNACANLSVEWLSISVSLRALQKPMDVRQVGVMLSRNAQIQGSPRIIGCAHRHQRQVAVDIPTDLIPWYSKPDIEKLLTATIAELGAAMNANPTQAALPQQPPLPREQLETMLDEAGWPLTYGEDESLQVPLDVSRSYHAATVSHDSSSIHLHVSLLASQRPHVPDPCWSAAATLLWLVASRVRMVRPTRTKRALALDVTLPPGDVSAAALAHGCAVLSVSLQQLVAEAELLIADECLAQTYLSNLGFETAARRVSRDSSLSM